MKIAVVTPIPTPYRDPFWNEVAKQPNIDLNVFYCSGGKSDRPWSDSWEKHYTAEVLPGINLLGWRDRSASCYWNPAIGSRLRNGGYEAVVVGGYNHPTMLAAIHSSLRLGIPYFLMCESHQRRVRPRAKVFVKDRLVEWIVRRAAGGFPTGTLAEQYLLGYGASPESLARIPNVPDVERFERSLDRDRTEAARLRMDLGVGDRDIVLFVGRLIFKKRPALALRAFARTAQDHDAVLVILGDGPLRAELDRIVGELGLRDRVLLRGFVEPDEVILWQSLARVFLLPSSETWGVALLEAVAAGTPVIVSNEVGSYVDVVVDERIGSVVAAGDEVAAANALQSRLGNGETREHVRMAWSAIRGHFTYSALAHRFCEHVRCADAASADERARKEVGV
jgi:glycosyltransferase involved in cell wall biosynthesis